MRLRCALLVLLIAAAALPVADCFQQHQPASRMLQPATAGRVGSSSPRLLPTGNENALTRQSKVVTTTTTTTALFDNNSNSNKKRPEFSRELLLREEAENPFRKVRFFFYGSLGAGALVSLLVSITRVAAALSGINPDLLPESSINAAVDAGGLVVLGLLWRNDLQAEQSRLQRASKGAALAQLKVRLSKSLLFLDGGDDGGTAGAGVLDKIDSSISSSSSSATTFTTSLASLRRGRGIEKRVVIAAAGRAKIAAVLKDAKDLADALTVNDLLVVPVVIPGIALPADLLSLLQQEGDDDASGDPLSLFSECVALPVGNSWSVVIDDEVRQAIEQGIDVDQEGLCVILKKNGRVGQRTRGIFLNNLVGEVTRRRDAGMDVVNI
jgi:Low psii accumulation1 / Rep27